MNRDIVYPSTDIHAYQLSTLDAIGVFDVPIGGMPDDHARLPEPDDTDNVLTDRARAYLHANLRTMPSPERAHAGGHRFPLRHRVCGHEPVRCVTDAR